MSNIIQFLLLRVKMAAKNGANAIVVPTDQQIFRARFQIESWERMFLVDMGNWRVHQERIMAEFAASARAGYQRLISFRDCQPGRVYCINRQVKISEVNTHFDNFYICHIATRKLIAR